MSFCPSCGRGIADHAQFCAHCGAALHGPAPSPGPAPGYAVPGPAPAYAPAAPRHRPTGVAILAVLGFIGAAVYGLGGLFLLLGGGAVASLGASTGNDFGAALGGMIGTIVVFVGILALALGGLAFLIARGLWMGRPWARTLQVVFAWIGLVLAGLGLLGAIAAPAALFVQLPFVALYAFILWYFAQPGVKQFFASDAPIA